MKNNTNVIYRVEMQLTHSHREKQTFSVETEVAASPGPQHEPSDTPSRQGAQISGNA